MSDTSDGEGVTPSTGPPAETVPAPSSPPRRRGGRQRILIAILVLVVGAGAVWWRKTVTADPELTFTLFNRVVRAEHEATGDPEGVTRKANQLGTQYELAFAAGKKVFVELGLRNDGGHAVQIDKVPPAGFYYFGFDGMEVSSDPAAPLGALTAYEPFKPFTLGAGKDRSVRLTFRMADCSSINPEAGGHSSITGILVEYKILGFRRGWAVPFQQSVLSVPATGTCEHPITDSSIPNPLWCALDAALPRSRAGQRRRSRSDQGAVR